MTYMHTGKQILTRYRGGWAHFADARDSEAAALIVAALNGDPPAPERDAPPRRHAVRQEGDEYACKCGKRWAVDEGEEGHP